MLNYINEQLRKQGLIQEQPVDNSERQMNEAILECATLFQELDDLSMDGTEAGSSRPYTKVDIPLEDDVEISTVELNLLDGRVTDVPMDATLQEQMQHQGMREWNDFYQEAYSELRQFPRETDHEFTERVAARADQKFQEYRNYVIQEGLFGFDKIPASSPEVPWKYTGYFGKDPNRGSEYIVRLPIAYQVDRHDRLTKKQLTSIHMAQERSEEICKGFRDLLYDKYRSQFDLKNEDDVWNYVTPAKVLVPIDPADQYFVLFVFDVDDQEEPSYWSWSLPVRGRKGVADGKSKFANVDNISEKKIASMKLLDRKGVKMESAEIKKPQFSRFFQEAIDFGNTDEAPAAGDGNGVSFDEAPAADGDAPALDASADGQKEVVDTNDVSDQIAEKVADETEAKNASDDLNIDAANTDATDDTSVDLSDTPSDDEIEADLNGGDTTDTVEEPAATSDVDIENMTIDELLAQCTEKLKSMPIQQLRDFMSDNGTATESLGDAAAPDATTEPTEEVQEAFFLTRGNIGKELDIHLRKSLGILNSSDMEIDQLCEAFRREGRKVNRVVHRASKMPKVFNEQEIKQLKLLNQCTTDLMKMMRSDLDATGVATVKRLIQAFVQSATGVLKLIEKDKNTKTVQEGFFDKRQKVSETDRARQLKSLSPARMSFLKKNGIFDKIFGKTKKDDEVPSNPKPIITTSDGFQITEEQFGKLLKTVEENTATDAIYMNWSKAPETVKPDASVIGGIPPYVPEIPVTKDGKQMTFILQINFADIKSSIVDLPTSGLLQLWINTRDDLYGSDNFKESRGGYKLIYYKDTSAPSKDDELDESLYTNNAGYLFNDRKQRLISFEKTTESLQPYSDDETISYDEEFAKVWNQTFPENQITARDVWDILKQADDSVFKKYLGSYYNKIANKIGGYPYFIQHDSRPSEFAKDNSMMLMQLESDEVFMWGDCGNAQIFIKLSDLKKSDFSKTFYDWQCY